MNTNFKGRICTIMEIKNKFSFLFSLIGLLLVLTACNRNDNEFIGPAFIVAPEGFTISNLTGTPSAVDFTLENVELNSTFSHSVNWILTIKGEESGAVKTFRGISQSLDNLQWTGNHDGDIFFRKGEIAKATLSFYGTTLTTFTTILINKSSDFTIGHQFPTYGDFEDPSKINHANAWHAFNDPNAIPNVEQGVGSSEKDFKGNIISAIQGINYYFIRGLGNQANFVSGIQYDTGNPLSPVTSSNPNEVWVNMYIYGTGDANAQVELEYQEADASDIKSPNKYDGEHDDAFVAKITLDHIGWKLFSFQYSKLTPSLNVKYGGSGNKIHEPHKLMSFDLILVKKNNASSPVEVYFDYPIITEGGPFKP